LTLAGAETVIARSALVCGDKDADAVFDTPLLPAALVLTTVNEYVWPLVSPLMRAPEAGAATEVLLTTVVPSVVVTV
jgi:hypothetical protein